MAVDPAKAHELAEIASDIDADVLEGALRYPSDTGGQQPHGTMPKSTATRLRPVVSRLLPA